MIALLLVLVGCQNEELVNETTDTGNGKKVTLTATIAGAANSRVVLSDKDENNNPLLDENDNPIVMVNWEESDEKFNHLLGLSRYRAPISLRAHCQSLLMVISQYMVITRKAMIWRFNTP